MNQDTTQNNTTTSNQEKIQNNLTTSSKSNKALSQSESELVRVHSLQDHSRKSIHRLATSLEATSQLRKWEAMSKVNLMSMRTTEGGHAMSMTSLHLRNMEIQPTDHTLESTDRPDQIYGDTLLTEKFLLNVTNLMNEEQLWGCFYNFPELYGDAYSPVVRVRSLEDVPDIVGGVLTRDVISTCLTYLKRIPILEDYVFIKLDLSNKHLVNIEVLQHYKYLVYLDLSSNYLTELTVLSNLLYLQFLSVSYNRLSTILEYEVPQWFLTEVHYKYNSVKRIRDLTMFWSITILDLSHNNIKCISGLENLAYLRRLDLSFNHIQRLENLNNLRLLWLDVSYNNISSFEFSTATGLWTLYHLEYLNLNENNLVSMKIFSCCTRLQEIHARNNRLSMLLELAVYMRQLRRLVNLDLRANPLCDTPGYKEVIINTFPTLLNLDAEQLDPVEQRDLKMDVAPDVNMFASRRLLRLLYMEQLTRAKVSLYVPPADTTEIPLIIFVGYEAVGKGTLARRLADEYSSKINLAVQHTTATFHYTDHYHEVTRSKFDEMLLAGDFLTYTEMDGESYGLSRKESFIKDGKVKMACMDLTSALMVSLRGRRPYLILTTCQDKSAMRERQHERKDARNTCMDGRTSIEVPIEKSTLQVLLSGRILVTGIINEILMTLPEDKRQSEFLIESKCSLMMDSEARKAIKEYAKGLNVLQLLNSSNSSLENACNEIGRQNEASLYSLYKESQGGTDEYASDIGHNSSIQGSKRSTYVRHSRHSQTKHEQKLPSEMLRPKSVDFRMSGTNSAKSSKSVTFTSQDAEASADPTTKEKGRDSLPRELTGLYLDAEDTKDVSKAARSLSTKFPWSVRGHPPPGRTASSGSIDDGDLWLSFLVDTGLLQASDLNLEPSFTAPRHETRVDDPEYILKQLAIYRTIPSQTFTTNIRDDYEDIHRQCPGVFWDTITMDDPEAAFNKAKKIIKAIFESQPKLKPMFDIEYAKMGDECPLIQQRILNISDQVAPQRFFY